MYASCIFLHLIEINFLLSQLGVPFLDIVLLKRVIYVLMHTLIEFMFPEMLFSLKINVSFLCLPPQPLLLPLYPLLMTLLPCKVFQLTGSSHIWCTKEDFLCCPLQLLSCHLLLLCTLLWLLRCFGSFTPLL